MFCEVLAEIGVESRPVKGVDKAFSEKKHNLWLDDIRQDIMVKVYKEAVKNLIRGKRQGNTKIAVVCYEKVIIQIIDKICNHREVFAFHNNKGTNHGMV